MYYSTVLLSSQQKSKLMRQPLLLLAVLKSMGGNCPLVTALPGVFKVAGICASSSVLLGHNKLESGQGTTFDFE